MLRRSLLSAVERESLLLLTPAEHDWVMTRRQATWLGFAILMTLFR